MLYLVDMFDDSCGLLRLKVSVVTDDFHCVKTFFIRNYH